MSTNVSSTQFGFAVFLSSQLQCAHKPLCVCFASKWNCHAYVNKCMRISFRSKTRFFQSFAVFSLKTGLVGYTLKNHTQSGFCSHVDGKVQILGPCDPHWSHFPSQSFYAHTIPFVSVGVLSDILCSLNIVFMFVFMLLVLWYFCIVSTSWATLRALERWHISPFNK